jgi:prevent-host-death family protein
VKTLTALDVRKRFGAVLDLVADKRVPVTIVRGSRRLVVMLPADEYEARTAGRASRLRLAVDRMNAWKEGQARKLGGLDAVRLVRESRDRR